MDAPSVDKPTGQIRSRLKVGSRKIGSTFDDAFREAKRKEREARRIGDPVPTTFTYGGKKYTTELAKEQFIYNYLLDEGFASDEKSVQAIAGAMSESWIESIVEVWSSKLPGADALDRAELEKIKTVKTPTGQKVTTNKQYPATLNKEKGTKSYGPSGTEYFTPNIPGTNISDPNRAKFKSVSSGQYENIPADQSSHLRTGVPKVDDSTKYNPSYKPPGMRK